MCEDYQLIITLKIEETLWKKKTKQNKKNH